MVLAERDLGNGGDGTALDPMTDLDEPLFGDHLPDAMWLPLGSAMLFALCGQVPLDDEPWEASEIEPRPGSILYGVLDDDFGDAFLGFEKAMHRAAAAGAIRFMGVRAQFFEDARNVDGEDAELIPADYFGRMQRGFDEAEQKIGVASLYGDLDRFEPATRRPAAHTEWLGVTVERATFVSFLQDAYPGCMIGDSAEAIGESSSRGATQVTKGSPRSQAGATTEGSLVDPDQAPKQRSPKASKQLDRAAAALRELYPSGRPPFLSLKQIARDVNNIAGTISDSTIKLAMKKAWLEGENLNNFKWLLG